MNAFTNKLIGKTALVRKISAGFLNRHSLDTKFPLFSCLVSVPSIIIANDSLLRSYQFKIIERKRRNSRGSKYTDSGQSFTTFGFWY